MGDDLALARMLSSISGTEESPVDRNKRVIELALFGL